MAEPGTGGAAGTHPDGSGAASGADALTPDEQNELEQLRAEVGRLQRQKAAWRPRLRHGWHTPVAIVLIVLGCLLAPLSVVGIWASNQVSNTNRYVANVQPLISEPSVQHALTDRISNAITTNLDVKGRVDDAAAALSKPAPSAADLLGSVSGSIASGVNGFIHDHVATFVASPRAAQLWTQANQTLHAGMVKVLSGQSPKAITMVNGQVVLNLGPFIDQAKKNLAADGLTAVNSIPYVNPTYPLFPSKYLVQARNGYQFLTTLAIVLPILALFFLAAGIFVGHGRRRALIGAGLGVAAAMLVLGAALAIVRSVFLGNLPPSASAPAAADSFDIFVRFVKDGLRLVLAVGLIVAVGAFFTGPSATAVHTRTAFTKGVGWVRASGETAGLRTGPVGRWTYTHRMGLRISALALAAVIFVSWSQPSGMVALVIALILLVVLGLIELIGRPPAEPATHQA